MRKKLLVPLLVLIFSSFSFAQFSGYNELTLIDEFGRLGHCDLTARTDNLYISIQNNNKTTETKGVVVFYRGTSELPGAQKPLTVRLIKEHIRWRELDPSLVSFVDGGYRETETYELWVVPKGAQQPVPSGTLPKPEMPVDKTFLWDKTIIEPEFGYLEKSEIILEQYESMYSETDGEPVAESEIPLESGSKDDRWISNSFGEYLVEYPSYSGVIIYYLDDAWFDNDKVIAEIERGRAKIAEETGVEVERISIVYGGYRPWVQSEFWIMGSAREFPDASPGLRPEPEDETGYSYGEIGN